MNPWLRTTEEITDDDGCRSVFGILKENRPWKPVEEPTDTDDVDLYSDYGGGFYWHGTGSESSRMILSNLMPYDECYDDMKDGYPEWVNDFLTHDMAREDDDGAEEFE